MADVPRPVTEFSAQVLGNAWPLQSESSWSASATRLTGAAHQLWSHAAGPQFDLAVTLAPMSGAYIDAAIAVVRRRQTILENRAKGYQFAGRQAGAVAARILTVKNRLEEIVYHTEATVTAARNELEPQIMSAAAAGNAALALALAAELQDRIESAVTAGQTEAAAEDVEGATEVQALHAGLTAWQPPYEVPAEQTPTAAAEPAPASAPAATPNAQLAAHRSVAADQSAAGRSTAATPGRVQSTAFHTDPTNRPQPALSQPTTPALPEQSSPGFGTLHQPAAATPAPTTPRAASPTPRPALSPTPTPSLPPPVTSGTGPGISGSMPGGAMPGPGLALPSAPMGPGAIPALTSAAASAAAQAPAMQALAHVQPTEPPPPAHLATPPPPVQPPAEPRLHSLIPPADPVPAPATPTPSGPPVVDPQPAAPAEPAPSGAGPTGGTQPLGAANLAAGLLLPPLPPPPPPPPAPPVTPPPQPAAKALPLHTAPPPQQDPTPDHRDDTVHPLDYAVDSVKDAEDVREELKRLPRQGKKNVYLVPSLPELQDMFKHLTENGAPIPGRNNAFRLPDGTEITFRKESSSGGETIDINMIDRDGDRKIHIAKNDDDEEPKPKSAPPRPPAEEPDQEPTAEPGTPSNQDPGILKEIGKGLIGAGVAAIAIVGGIIRVLRKPLIAAPGI